MFKNLKLFNFSTLAIAALLLAFFPLVSMVLICAYIAVDLLYLSKQPTTVSPARKRLDRDLSSFRLYTLLGVFVMTPFDSLLLVALGGAIACYWLWGAYTAIRDYEAAEAAAQDDNDDDASAAP